jgi:hypothetical protein
MSSGSHYFFVLGRSKVRISARRLTVVTEAFGGYSALPATCQNSTLNMSRPFSSCSLFTNYPITRRHIIPSIESVIRFEPGSTPVGRRNAKHSTANIISCTTYCTDLSTDRSTRPHCPSRKHLGHLVDIQYEQNRRAL